MRRSPGRSRVALYISLIALFLLGAACTTADDEVSDEAAGEPGVTDEQEVAEEAPEEEEVEAGELEVTELNVGIIPILAVTPLFAAIEAGFFEEEGLTVTAEAGAGGAEYMARMLGGELDVIFTAYMPGIQAASEGVPAQFIAHAYSTTVGQAMNFVITLPDSGVETVADMEGRTIAINTLNTVGHLMVVAALEDAGVDIDSIEFVEVPFPSMPPALERGEVDVVWIPEPFKSFAEQELGAFAIVDPAASEPVFHDHPAFYQTAIAGYMMTDEFVEENPNTVAAFQRALHRANDLLDPENDLDFAVEVVMTFTTLEEDVLRRVTWPTWGPMPMDRVQEQADLMYEHGFIDAPVDVSAFVNPEG